MLAACAGLSVIGVGLSPAAMAADMVTKAASTNVKQCLGYGEGFYYIPGTETCINVGGFVRAEGYFNNYNSYPTNFNQFYTISTGALILDARSQTEYGTLRSFMDLRMLWRTSNPWSDGPNAAEVDPHYMYIQFGGFTAGRLHSFFDFYADADIYGTDPGIDDDDVRPNLIAYTQQLGHGLSATVSLEDGAFHDAGVLAANPALPGLAAGTDYTGGHKLPALVGALVAEGAWGTAQLSGVVRQINATVGANPAAAVDGVGYALQAGVKLNVPTGSGDHLYLQAAYGNGASAYLELQTPSGEYAPPDAFLGVNGLTLVTGWNALFSYLHNWNEKWGTSLYGSYAKYDYNDPTAQFFYGISGAINYELGGNIIFTPVKNLTFVLQYDYTFSKGTDYVAAAPFAPSMEEVRANQFLLMVERDF